MHSQCRATAQGMPYWQIPVFCQQAIGACRRQPEKVLHLVRCQGIGRAPDDAERGPAVRRERPAPGRHALFARRLFGRAQDPARAVPGRPGSRTEGTAAPRAWGLRKAQGSHPVPAHTIRLAPAVRGFVPTAAVRPDPPGPRRGPPARASEAGPGGRQSDRGGWRWGHR